MSSTGMVDTGASISSGEVQTDRSLSLDAEFNPMDYVHALGEEENSISGTQDDMEAALIKAMNLGPESAQAVAPQEAAAKQQAPQTDAPQAQEAESKADEAADKWAKKFAQLNAMDRQARARAQELKAKEQSLAEVEALRERLLTNPLDTILELGIDPDKLYERKVVSESEKPKQELEQLKAELRRELDAIKQESTNAKLMAQGARWDAEYEALTSSDDYKIVKAWDPTGDAIREHVAEEYHKTGILLTPGQVLKTIKGSIEEKLNALQSAGLYAQPATTGSARGTASNMAHRKPQTLTNAVDDTPSYRTSKLDDEDDMERITAKYSR